MEPELQGFEIERASLGDHHFAVDDAPRGQGGLERRGKLGKVSIERLFVATLNEELLAVAKDEDAKAVPLWLEDPAVAVGNPIHALRKHWQKRRVDRELHGPIVMRRPWPRRRGLVGDAHVVRRSEERRVGKECRSR